MEKKDFQFQKPRENDYIIGQFNEKIINTALGMLTVQDANFLILRDLLWEARKQTKLLEFLCSDKQEKTADDI